MSGTGTGDPDYQGLADRLDRMIEEEGLSFPLALAAFARHQPDTAESYIEAAQGMSRGGAIEVDMDTIVSQESDEEIEDAGGAYVLAWMWVDKDDLDS